MKLNISNNQIIGVTGEVVDNINEANEAMLRSAYTGSSDTQNNIIPAKYISFENEPVPDNISVKKPGYCVFEEGVNTEIVLIPDGIIGISPKAFHWCRSLTCITVPNSVKWIGASAFEGCKSLASITIPDSVTYIGRLAIIYTSTTIICSKGSYADKYAKQNGIKVKRPPNQKSTSTTSKKTSAAKTKTDSTLVKENKELRDKNAALRKEIEELKKQIKEMEQVINKINALTGK